MSAQKVIKFQTLKLWSKFDRLLAVYVEVIAKLAKAET